MVYKSQPDLRCNATRVLQSKVPIVDVLSTLEWEDMHFLCAQASQSRSISARQPLLPDLVDDVNRSRGI